jgi:hypothetical protein
MALFGLFGGEAGKREAFAREVIDALTRGGQQGPWTYDAPSFAVRSDKTIFNLDNVWQQYLAAPRAARSAIFERFAAPLAATPTNRDELLACLRPMVRDRLWLELYGVEIRRVTGAPFQDTVPHLPLADHHVVSLVAWKGASMSTVTSATLEAAQVNEDEAFAAAGANLRKLPPGLRELKPGLWVSVEEDDFDASRLLGREARQVPVRGAPVALAANRNALFVVGDRDDDTLEMLIAIAAKELSEPRSLAPLLLRFEDGEWKNWLPAPGSRNRAALERWELKAKLDRYNRQKAELEALEKEVGEGAHPLQHWFYGTLMARDGGAKTLTFSMWFPTPTLLPRCELVCLRPEEKGPVIEVPWAAVAEVMGDRLVKLDGYPERFRADVYPEPAELERLKRVATRIVE